MAEAAARAHEGKIEAIDIYRWADNKPRPSTPRGSKSRGQQLRPLLRLPRLVTKGLSMNPSIVKMRLPRLVEAGELPAMVPAHAPVRVDGDCLLPAGGGPVHASHCSHVPEATRFAASHIEPIEDET